MDAKIIVALVVIIAVAAHTQLSAERVAAVCARSKEILADPQAEHSWRVR